MLYYPIHIYRMFYNKVARMKSPEKLDLSMILIQSDLKLIYLFKYEC